MMHSHASFSTSAAIFAPTQVRIEDFAAFQTKPCAFCSIGAQRKQVLAREKVSDYNGQLINAGFVQKRFACFFSNGLSPVSAVIRGCDRSRVALY
jgi:hypothetical protein